MPVFRIRVSDTLTYRREATLTIVADTVEEAKDTAHTEACDGTIVWEVNEQIDNTSYDIEELED